MITKNPHEVGVLTHSVAKGGNTTVNCRGSVYAQVIVALTG